MENNYDKNHLTEKEIRLLNIYRTLKPENQQSLLQHMRELCAEHCNNNKPADK